ncbi:hypothetical protein B0H10DRAFT_1991805 [Mycena sp. CBHHK59/15]|nr:hypothetical protein B0H10DRAFT_1991805 [Mycena sp. CBHHK59/15]
MASVRSGCAMKLVNSRPRRKKQLMVDTLVPSLSIRDFVCVCCITKRARKTTHSRIFEREL